MSNEVDFVYGEKGLHAFEIKRSANINQKSLRGLRAFQKDYPEAKLHLLYLGTHREYHQRINIIPFLGLLQAGIIKIFFYQLARRAKS